MKRTLRPAALLLLIASSASAGGDEPAGALTLVRARVAEAVGRPIEIAPDLERGSRGWVLVCGEPVEASGAPFDLERSRLAGSEFGAHFCALLQETELGPRIVEFDIGSNDMPAVGWIEEHGLPPELVFD